MNDQRLMALDRANRIRLARADVKRELRNGTLTIADALIDERARGLSVWVLLLSQPRWGEERCRRFFDGVSVTFSPFKAVGGLTGRQRALVVERVGLLAPRSQRRVAA